MVAPAAGRLLPSERSGCILYRSAYATPHSIKEAIMNDAKDSPAWLMAFFTGFSAVLVIGVLVYAIVGG